MLRPQSYLNQQLKLNNTRAQEIAGGLSNLNNLNHLFVKGKSQLLKELEECTQLETKIYDSDAVHRNEITLEVEPEGFVDEMLDSKIDFYLVSG